MFQQRKQEDDIDLLARVLPSSSGNTSNFFNRRFGISSVFEPVQYRYAVISVRQSFLWILWPSSGIYIYIYDVVWRRTVHDDKDA